MKTTVLCLVAFFAVAAIGCNGGQRLVDAMQVHELELSQLDRLENEQAKLKEELDKELKAAEVSTASKIMTDGAEQLARIASGQDVELPSEEDAKQAQQKILDAAVSTRQAIEKSFESRFDDVRTRITHQKEKVRIAKEAVDAAAKREEK